MNYEGMNCDRCGRFHDHGPGSAWKMIYSGAVPLPDREISRCKVCVQKYGAFVPQSGIKPEASCGVVQQQINVNKGVVKV